MQPRCRAVSWWAAVLPPPWARPVHLWLAGHCRDHLESAVARLLRTQARAASMTWGEDEGQGGGPSEAPG